MTDVRHRRPAQRSADLHVDDPVDEDKKQNLSPSRRRRSGFHHTSIPHTAVVLASVVVFYSAVLGFVTYASSWLPEPLPLDAPQTSFSEARTRVVLEEIMSFGSRIVGTHANEVLTPTYLIQQIEAIQAMAGDDVTVEMDVQRPSGAFGLDFLAQFQNIYANVTNILVRVTPANPSAEVLNNSLLLSSHYDAAIGGAAASDDGVSIAIMMELLRLYVVSPPKYASLVFNFNGAEETVLQAAHGFITQHPWTETIRAFINMEAAGAGGRELLFQTGSDELALAYAQGAKYPHASIIAQELFQSGVIPADTDYRIYRDFGYVAGMDFAYINNGYVYHTHLDDISRIQQGAIQRFGENVAGVINQLANQPGRLEKVAATPESSNTLFFDVAGYMMVTMGKKLTFLLCGGVLVLTSLYLLLVSPITFTERVQAVKLTLKCLATGLAATLGVGILMTIFTPLSWYSQPLWAAALFLPPVIAGMLHQLIKFVEKQQAISWTSEDAWHIEESLFEAVLLGWVSALVVLLWLGKISSYSMAIWVFFPLVGQGLCQLLQKLRLLSPGVYLWISLCALVLPVLHSSFSLAIAFIFFLPLMGRSGPQVPPDLIVSALFCMSFVMLVSFAGRFFCFFPVPKLRVLRNALIAITGLVIIFASLRNPYSDVCPKRMMVQHVHRELQLPSGEIVTDSGLWLNALDFRGPSPLLPFLAKTQWKNLPIQIAPVSLHENAGIYGDMPFALPVKHLLPTIKSWYLPAAAPALPNGVDMPKLEIISSKYSAETNRRTVHLHFTGPSHLNIFIDATATKLVSWSIGNGINGPVPASNDTYILQFASGTPPSNYHFWIEAESDKPIDMVIVGHYLQVVTPEMQEFIEVLPTWTTIMKAVSTWRKMQI